MSWYDSHLMCTMEGQRLITMGMPSAIRDFHLFVASLPKPRLFIFLSAQLLERREATPVAAFYKHIWQWTDGRSAFFINITFNATAPRCAYYDVKTATVKEQACHKKLSFTHLLCQFDKNTTLTELSPRKWINATDAALSIEFSKLNSTLDFLNRPMIACTFQRHLTKDFLSCDARSGCLKEESENWCETGGVTVPMFHCGVGHVALHYSLVCDHIVHCLDRTDEDFCHFETCPLKDYQCHSGQCVSIYRHCDKNLDCYDGSDELCKEPFHRQLLPEVRLPVVLEMDGKGSYSFLSKNSCPDTHFLCPEGVCLPVYLRCNKVPDCLEKEDEKDCENFVCPGFYRCWGSYVCLHPNHVCDGVPHCPHWDDELLCEMDCPTACRCQGLAFVCNANFNASAFPHIRYLDASGSNMGLKGFFGNGLRLLVRLHLSRSNISTITFMTLSNLQYLDLSHNQIASIDMVVFSSLRNLRVLDLSNNPLSDIINTDATTSHPVILRSIDLSFTELTVYNGSTFTNCQLMETINMSWSKLTTILEEEGFKSTPLLQTVDTRRSLLTNFPKNVLTNLKSLKTVYVDNYILCCPVMLPPDFNLNNCHSKQDLLASCDDLLKSNTYRIFLWVFAAMAIVGNVGSFVARIYLDGSTLGSFGVFVTNLSLADFLMGIYLAVIGTADIVYRGRYLFHDKEWKQSFACTIAGCLSFLSSEVSALIICFITLDRFLVLRFPFRQAPFSRRSALVTCGIIWAVGFVLIIVPLLPATSHWQFYSQNGICIPLPFSSSDGFPGYTYSFTVMIVLNFTLFILIAIGQVVIYWSVRVNSVASKDRATRDATIARRLTLIVLSDFACWFPIGLLGVMASTGTPIPDEVNVAMAIIVMPINSALNPFLYTFNVLMEKRQKAREDYLLQKLEARQKTSSVTRSAKAEALSVIQTYLKNGTVTRDEVSQLNVD